MLHDICVGKTGTLTTSNITVKSYQIGDEEAIHTVDAQKNPTEFKHTRKIKNEMKEMIKEGIISNSDVRIETSNELCIYKPEGQATEVGLIQFLMDNEYDIQNVMINRNKLAAASVWLSA